MEGAALGVRAKAAQSLEGLMPPSVEKEVAAAYR